MGWFKLMLIFLFVIRLAGQRGRGYDLRASAQKVHPVVTENDDDNGTDTTPLTDNTSSNGNNDTGRGVELETTNPGNVSDIFTIVDVTNNDNNGTEYDDLNETESLDYGIFTDDDNNEFDHFMRDYTIQHEGEVVVDPIGETGEKKHTRHYVNGTGKQDLMDVDYFGLFVEAFGKQFYCNNIWIWMQIYKKLIFYSDPDPDPNPDPDPDKFCSENVGRYRTYSNKLFCKK